MNDPQNIPAETLLQSAKRELAMRERVYPKWVASGRMAGDKADHETACQRAIVALLEKQVDEEKGQASLF